MTIPAKLPFEQVNKHALAAYPGKLEEWLPGGKVVGGKEYLATNPTRADRKPGSFSINIKTGQWMDGATGDAGGDPISLYGYLFCGGTDRQHRVEACKRLAAELGLSDDAPTPRPVKARPAHLRVVKDDEPAEWQPIVPPPDGVAPPLDELAKWDREFRYLDQAGKLLRFVVRDDAKGDQPKKIRPLTYGILKGVPCWDLRGPNNPKSLYGLERLDGRPVLLQEGELKTDQVAGLLPGYACLSLTGGAGGKNSNDLEPLRGRPVLLVPDNDAGGLDTMRRVAELLTGMGCAVLIVDTGSHGFPAKWDLGDAVEDGWTADRIEAFLKKNRHPFDPAPGDVDLGDDGPDWSGDDPRGLDRHALPPIPLGYDNGVYFYLSPLTGQVEPVARRSHKKDDLIGIAGLKWFERQEQFKTGKNGELDWTIIGSFLKGACSDVGPYDPERLRGRGAWIDQGRSVLHLGEYLVIDGEVSRDLMVPGSRFVYERKLTVDQTIAPAISTADAHKLLEICKSLNWEKPIFGTLFAGWLAVAAICGGLKWRPAIWVTGGTGTGKTTLFSNIVEPILGEMHLAMAGGSTEAGIRQKLRNDALPIVFDEAEAENSGGKARIQSVLELVRQSTSEGGAAIVKGTQAQTGARSFAMRSCFMFLSINVSIHHAADENRITVLGLENRKLDQDQYDALIARMSSTITPTYCAGFLARSVRLLPTIRANAATFARAVGAHLGSARIGDQIGTLLAGAFSLTSAKEISLEDARAWVEAQDWTDTTAADAETDEQRLLGRLMQQPLTVRQGGHAYDRTVGGLIAAAAALDPNVDVKVANDVLLAHGLKFDSREGGVWVANKHLALEGWLKDTPWASGWNRALKRLPGAQPSTGPVWFGTGGAQPRAVFVPINLAER